MYEIISRMDSDENHNIVFGTKNLKTFLNLTLYFI